jgi:hypothetical protein
LKPSQAATLNSAAMKKGLAIGTASLITAVFLLQGDPPGTAEPARCVPRRIFKGL